MPQLGESIAEATIMHRLVAPGDVVTAEQEVFEVETNKAVMGVTCVCGGTVKSIAVSEGETVPVGSVLGIIEAMAKAYISMQLANSIVFAVLIVVLLVKPTGILGKKINVKV